MRVAKFESLRVAFWAFVVAFGVCAGVFAFLKNPSKKTSMEHLEIMSRDMDSALSVGGVVVSTYSNAKIGGSLLMKNISAISWSAGLAENYRRELERRGWVLKVSGGRAVIMCKDGMIARIGGFSEKDSSRGFSREVYGFSMIYSHETVMECG